jgi:hypothetical protein
MDYAAAFDFVSALEHDSNRFGIDSVLFPQDSRRKRVLGVVVFDGHD